ncbi:hypothetical protein P171DRAFT_95022 [Karstenula rhodostoma CBS 690.94]|uniref:Uncharacterized protein n=1 Tax=Karstenula rhodostoma CBS 690.94 TaxID=1392251 RepID=A0A9P4PDT1_9PLEO|nr:hypothetical protein P171DRAFT_95022 [Karstenula rhodostoma CBS 690.94]
MLSPSTAQASLPRPAPAPSTVVPVVVVAVAGWRLDVPEVLVARAAAGGTVLSPSVLPLAHHVLAAIHTGARHAGATGPSWRNLDVVRRVVRYRRRRRWERGGRRLDEDWHRLGSRNGHRPGRRHCEVAGARRLAHHLLRDARDTAHRFTPTRRPVARHTVRHDDILVLSHFDKTHCCAGSSPQCTCAWRRCDRLVIRGRPRSRVGPRETVTGRARKRSGWLHRRLEIGMVATTM